MYYSDTNNDHGCNWSDSFVGKAWLAQGEVMWQERLILPGCEIRERYHPAGSPLYLMCNSKKLEGNQGGGKGPTQTRGTKTKVPETVGIKTKVTRTKVTVTKTTKTATKGTPVLRVTKVVAEGTRGRTPQGVNTTRPRGITTRAPALRINKVYMMIMPIHLISLTLSIQYHALLHLSFQQLFLMNFCMIRQLYLLITYT